MGYETEGRFNPALSAVESRIAFVRSVYLWLVGGFVVAGCAALLALVTTPWWYGMFQSMGQLFGWLLFGAQMGSIFFAQAVSRRKPLNILAYVLVTGISGYIAGIISIIYAHNTGIGTVLSAAGLTAVDFFVLTIIAFVSKKDFSFLRSFVIVGITVMFFGGLIAAIFQLETLSMVIAVVAVVACSAKILWDTSTMLRTEDLSDPAGFALSLFVSLYNIFISLLRLLGGRRS
jgi:modulator of FtsH protease